MEINKIYTGHCLETLKTFPDGIFNTCVTSPPYWGLRDYGMTDQLGQEATPEEFVSNLVEVFREVKRTLKDDGTLWVNLGDTYAGSGGSGNQFGQLEKGLAKYKQINKPKDIGCKPKDLVGIPWMVAFALRADGWYLRQDIIWSKPNPMPESVTDRCTKAHEYIFLLSKNQKYYYDNEAIKEPSLFYGIDKRSDKGNIRYGGKRDTDNNLNGQQSFVTIEETRNKRSVWEVTTKPYAEAHFATYPTDLIVPCIKAGCPEGGLVLDPFFGSGTTGEVAERLQRNWVGCELNPEYVRLATKRTANVNPLFKTLAA